MNVIPLIYRTAENRHRLAPPFLQAPTLPIRPQPVLVALAPRPALARVRFGRSGQVHAKSACSRSTRVSVWSVGEVDGRHDAAVTPDAAGSCPGIDEHAQGADNVDTELDDDCNEVVDDAGAEVTWYPDADGDGYGDDAGEGESSCPPAGTASVGGDCDDASAEVHSGAAEVCNGIDGDCAEGVDNVGVSSTWCPDKDRDGRGSAEGAEQGACAPGPDWSRESGDCDDTDPSATSECEEGCGCQQADVGAGWMVALGLVLGYRRREIRGNSTRMGRAT
jgi:hypothetical protein